MERKDLI